jgi:ectoine hydroxylase-related dioxygenase (phytanoyl-CoA dioxygenase family)
MVADVDQTLDQLHRDGYVVLKRLIDAATVDRIKTELSPWLKGEKFGRNDFEGFRTERVYALLSKAPAIAELVEHPDILALTDRLLPPNYLLSSALAINVHPGETPQRFHIDDGAGSTMLSMPRDHLGVSTIWALDDFTETNGATEIVPGSHRWDALREPRPEEIRTLLMPAGSVVVFLGNLRHRGGANRSEGTRLAVTPQYCMPWLRQLENMVLSVPPPTAARYSPRVQALLGYSVVDPGFMGHVDGLHPRRLIDSDYQGRKVRDDLPPS